VAALCLCNTCPLALPHGAIVCAEAIATPLLTLLPLFLQATREPRASSELNMANVLQGGDGVMGGVGGFPLEQWFYEMPVCTRWWMTAALSASVLVQCHIISPFQLFYSVRTVFLKSQVP
jgi:hypothetical protein